MIFHGSMMVRREDGRFVGPSAAALAFAPGSWRGGIQDLGPRRGRRGPKGLERTRRPARDVSRVIAAPCRRLVARRPGSARFTRAIATTDWPGQGRRACAPLKT